MSDVFTILDTHTHIRKEHPWDSCLGVGGRVISIKNTVSDLCQSDRHFLAFSDTTRNERHSKSGIKNGVWSGVLHLMRINFIFFIFMIFFGISLSSPKAAQEQEMKFILDPPSKIMSVLLGPQWGIYADGPIDQFAAERLENIIKKNNIPRFSTVYFNSPGGSVIVGIELGKVIRKYELRTSISKFNPNKKEASLNGICLSACTFAYIGGEFRFISDEDIFGVHRFYSTSSNDGSEDRAQILSGYIVKYLSEFGVDPTFFVSMTRAGPNEILHLSKPELVKMGVVNSGVGKTEWSIESSPAGSLYLRGVRKTTYGINKFMVLCDPQKKGGLVLYIIFDPQGRQKEVLQMGAQSLSVDSKTIPFDEFRIRQPTIKNGWLNAMYSIPENIADKISSAETVGFAFQYAYEAPMMLGFQGMKFGDGSNLYRGIRSACAK